MADDRMTLREAIDSNRLDEFIAQCEAANVGPAADAELERTLERVIRSPAGSRQASGSPDRGGSRGK